MTPEQLQRLEDEAARAVGQRADMCQIAMADIYKAAGLMPADTVIPSGPRDWAASQGRSLIEPWVDGSGLFDPIKDVEPGALLGFRVGHTLHHVAIALSRGRMVHVFGHHGIRIAPAIPILWAKRLQRIWRIKA